MRVLFNRNDWWYREVAKLRADVAQLNKLLGDV